jgi:hypothetical protein
MSDPNIVFCRYILRVVLAEVREKYPDLDLRQAWVWKVDKDHWEFHFDVKPYEYYWHGSADNAYEARANGWDAFLRHQEGNSNG